MQLEKSLILLMYTLLMVLPVPLRADPPPHILAAIRQLQGVRALVFDPRSSLLQPSLSFGQPLEQAYTTLRTLRRLRDLGFKGRIQLVPMESQIQLTAEEALESTFRLLQGQAPLPWDWDETNRQTQLRLAVLNGLLPGKETLSEKHITLKETDYLGPLEITPFSQANVFTLSGEMPLGLSGGMKWDTKLHERRSLNASLFMHFQPPFGDIYPHLPFASWEGITDENSSGKRYFSAINHLGISGLSPEQLVPIGPLAQPGIELVPFIVPYFTERDMIAFRRYYEAIRLSGTQTRAPIFVLHGMVNEENLELLQSLLEPLKIPLQFLSADKPLDLSRGGIVFTDPLPVPQLEWLVSRATYPSLVRSYTGRDLCDFHGKTYIDLEDQPNREGYDLDSMRQALGADMRFGDAARIILERIGIIGESPPPTWEPLVRYIQEARQPASAVSTFSRTLREKRLSQNDVVVAAFVITQDRFIDEGVFQRPVMTCPQALVAAKEIATK